MFIGVYALYVLTVLTTEYVKKRKRRRAEEEARAAGTFINESINKQFGNSFQNNPLKMISAPAITVTLDGETPETELNVMDRLDALRKSATSISRRSVVISSFTGNAHGMSSGN